jgi:hypothetical protein
MIFLMGCLMSEDDVSLYQKAIQQNNIKYCNRLNDSSRVSECTSTVAGNIAKYDPNKSLKICDKIKDSKWRGECFFLVSDTAQLIGDDARSVCKLSSPFEEDCLRHAAARDVEQNLYTIINNQQPMKLMPRIYDVLKTYLDEKVAQPMARDMLLRYLSSEITPPFVSDSCSEIPNDMCVQLFIISSFGSAGQWSGKEYWWKHCGKQITKESGKEIGFMDWHEDMSSIVSKAWMQMCNANQAIRPEAN